MQRAAIILAAAALFLAGAVEAGTQTPQQAPRAQPSLPLFSQGSPGWLGVELRYELDENFNEVVRIGAVVADGPADRAGVRVGDLLRAIDGEPPSRELLTRFTATLQPGTEVVLELERDGERETVVVEAERRPGIFVMTPRSSRAFPDSVLIGRPGATTLRLDSARLGFIRPDTTRVRVGVLRLDTAGVVYRGEAIRLDTTRVISLRGGTVGRDARVINVAPDSLFRVRSDARVLTLRPEDRVRRIELRERPAVVATGQRAVAGAELAPLNPGLADYFGVERGVLALQVIEGTPAYEGGLRPGDVVTEVAGWPVASVAELRRALDRGYQSPPVPVRIVREGESMTLRFHE